MNYEFGDPDPIDLVPTAVRGSFPEVYECRECRAQAAISEQEADAEGGGTDLNGGFRAVLARGWRPIVPRGVLCPSCVASCVDAHTDAHTQGTGHAQRDLFEA